MAQVTDGGQKSFTDRELDMPELIAAIEDRIASDDQAKLNRAARAVIKEMTPSVEGPTRFLVGERYYIEATVSHVDGHSVDGGRRQTNRVVARGPA